MKKCCTPWAQLKCSGLIFVWLKNNSRTEILTNHRGWNTIMPKGNIQQTITPYKHVNDPHRGLIKLLIHICAIVKLHLRRYARRLNHLNTYVIVRGHHMHSAWTSTVDATGLNFHRAARLVTHQNNTSCHAKSWSACSIHKQHMHARRLFKLWKIYITVKYS